MSTFLERLSLEESELSEKIVKLDAFVNGENFKNIDSTQQRLLKIQLKAMLTYSECLAMRLELLK